MKCASLRLDCCGLASTSFALGAAASVGKPQPTVRTATVTSSIERRSGSLALDDLGGGRCRNRLPGVVLVEAQRQRISLLGYRVLEWIIVAFATPTVEHYPVHV